MPRVKYQSVKLGKNQHELLQVLHAAGATGYTTKELVEITGFHIRSVQDTMKRLAERALVKKFALRHNKNKWYYSEIAEDFLTHWPALPPQAKSST